ncbi:MAG: hypothetical protein DI535_00865 [Citrobacter freundii]|nr:MAG: hypothetical protein DI535_00865 [Citrobacter freundii]
MSLSNLGIFHTAIGVIALAAGIVSFVRSGKIDLADRSGRIYLYGAVITSLTALGLSRHGGFNAGHVFSLFILILILIAAFLFYKKPGNSRIRHFENILFSFSFLLSLVPTINETFTRVPVGHPLAKDPSDPLIGGTLLGFFVLFIIGSILQFRRQQRLKP